MLTRRAVLATAVTPLLAARPAGLKIGVMDGVVKQRSKPAAVAAAKAAGAAGLQVTLGRSEDGSEIIYEDSSLQKALLAESRKHGLPVNSTYIDLLHMHCLKSDPQAVKDVLTGIEITKNLNAGILMTVFFGKCSVESRPELLYVADVFRDLAPEADKAGVILGFENLLTAEQQAEAMDRVASDAFKIYYDVGNSTNRVGVDAPKEIRWLGKERICEFHFKDDGYLGEGKVDFPEVLRAVDEVGFSGYAMLETGAPSGDWEADLNRNLEYLRGL